MHLRDLTPCRWLNASLHRTIDPRYPRPVATKMVEQVWRLLFPRTRRDG